MHVDGPPFVFFSMVLSDKCSSVLFSLFLPCLEPTGSKYWQAPASGMNKFPRVRVKCQSSCAMRDF